MNCEPREAFLNLRLDMMFAGIKALSYLNNTKTYALQIVVARFIGRWQRCLAAMNRRTTGL